VQVNPQAIKQMGGNPQEGVTLYKSYQLPPPEQRVGEDGKPIEMEPCPVCAGIGFVGRTAIFELILIDAEIRAALQKEPRLEPITRAVRQQGNLTLLEQAYRAVLDGRTALSEVQRVMQSKK
jgi:type II secretory ATPase GspE/PulE/Tfp pilus assembly ATPase PilB-like protein